MSHTRHAAPMRRPTGRLAKVAVVAALAVLATVGVVAVASAATAPAAPGAVGHDASYPQCSGGALPRTGAFGIVGVNGGRAFSANPCLASQYAWATGRPSRPGVYVNTGNPAPTSSFYWSASGAKDPARCTDNRSVTDPGCAYNYGWHAAEHALRTGKGVDPAMTSATWWLDVELANSWNGDGVANAADLQGAMDYLRSHGVASVGLYSTGHQWKTITGGYTAATAGSYRSAWRTAFTPKYPLESAPVWVATVRDGATAAAESCGAGFTGAAVQLVQFRDGTGLDADLVCGKAASATTPAAPRSVTAAGAAAGKGVDLSWAAPSTDGGAAVRSYEIRRRTSAGATTTLTRVSCSTPTCTWTDTGARSGTTFYYRVLAANTAGMGPASNEVSARAR